MGRLRPCHACDRAVRQGEVSCPFCDATLTPYRNRDLTRALVLAGAIALASACGEDEPARPEAVPPRMEEIPSPTPTSPPATLSELPRTEHTTEADGPQPSTAAPEDALADDRKRRERERRLARQRQRRQQQQLLKQKQLRWRDIEVMPPYGAPPPPLELV